MRFKVYADSLVTPDRVAIVVKARSAWAAEAAGWAWGLRSRCLDSGSLDVVPVLPDRVTVRTVHAIGRRTRPGWFI